MATLQAVKDPGQCADQCWVAVDADQTVEAGPYVVNGHPVVDLPHVCEIWSEMKQARIKQVVARRFWKRKRDVLAAIALCT